MLPHIHTTNVFKTSKSSFSTPLLLHRREKTIHRIHDDKGNSLNSKKGEKSLEQKVVEEEKKKTSRQLLVILDTSRLMGKKRFNQSHYACFPSCSLSTADVDDCSTGGTVSEGGFVETCVLGWPLVSEAFSTGGSSMGASTSVTPF